MKKIIALLLVFSIICLYGNLYAKERQGAELVIQKIDGQQVKGELIAVKKDSLLLKESKSGVDVSVDVKDIKVITIKKKSKALLGAGLGLLIGGLGGAVIGRAAEGDCEDCYGGLIGLILGVPIGLLVGLGIGGAIGGDEILEIGLYEQKKVNGKTQTVRKYDLEEALKKLRSLARVPNFQ